MAHRPRPARPSRAIPFDQFCDGLERLLVGGARRAIVEECGAATDLGRALARLREPLRDNRWRPGGQLIDLADAVEHHDQRTRQEGFHVLHDWDGKAVRFNETTIPLDVLDFVARQKGSAEPDLETIGVVLDYHLFHLLTLLSLRVWDTDDANDALDRLQDLLDALQGADGSEHQFCTDAETLLLIATAKYEPIEEGYDLLLERTRTLDAAHRMRVALGHASSMGCHLRFGFEAQYARDTVNMRNDNVADYPWLCFAVATVMEEYDRRRGGGAAAADGPSEARLLEALLNGLSGDARALIGEQPPTSLTPHGQERRLLYERFQAHRSTLLGAFDAYRPTDAAYSPLALFFNFSHNVVKGAAVDAMLWGEPWNVSFDGLLTALPPDDPTDEDKRLLAATLTAYARSAPDRIRGRLMPVIVYDPATGRQAFSVTLQRLRE
jgi:hypothetical protein